MSNYFIAFDTETGGLDEKKADLLTAYFCVLDEEFKIQEELSLKLKPDGGRLPVAEAGALRVNKINLQEHLADPETVSYCEGKEKLTTMLNKYLKKNGRFSNLKPMGYNVPFDIRWTQQHLLSQEEWQSTLHYKNVDVMERVDFLKEAGWFPPSLGSLNTVVDYLQLPKRNAHNAREDTLMTVDVYRKLLDIMKSKKNGGQAQDLVSLLESE